MRFAGTAGSSGSTVSVRSEDGRFDVSYLHLGSIAVRRGARVAAGEALGTVGTTGVRSIERPHLHFGVREAGTRHAYVDPLTLLPPIVAPPVRPPQPVPVAAPAPVRPAPAPVPVPAPRAPALRVPVPAALRLPAPAPHPSRPCPVPAALGRPIGAARVPHEPRAAAASPVSEAHRARADAAPSRRAGTPSTEPVRERARPRPEPSEGGPDVGWVAACAGLIAAALALSTGRGDRVAGAGAARALGSRPCCRRSPGGARGRASSIEQPMSYYVTTPIYYVNGEPHLGHAYTTIAADVLARHMRQRGEDVFFLTGTDEHGEPVAQAAEREGITPRELGDRNAVRFKELAATLNATNDFFIRTTDPEHLERVAEVVQRIHDNGHVFEGTYEGWFCPRCADFKTESEIEDGNRCAIHKIPLEWQVEDNWFFRLSAFQEPLERLYAERPDFVVPQERFNEALSFIQSGLQDLSLSRSRLKWGVPVPWDESQVVYVWIDALLNYYTALSYAREGEDLTDRFWPATLHLIGKDILKFHAVIWPALLMAAEIEVPRQVGIHGFLLLGEHKMSKSLGNVIEPFQVAELYGADALRYYALREVRFGQDGEVSPEGFETRYTTELANEYGNLASRTLAMIDRYRDGVVPEAEPSPELAKDFEGLTDTVKELLDRVEPSLALDEIWQRVKRLNRFVQDEEPWKLSKDEAEAGHLDEVLYSLAEGLRVVSVLLLAFMPGSAERLLAALGREDASLDNARFGALPGGGRISELPQLFPRVEPSEATAA